jgi:AcrR family transcriptional regulator
MQPTQHRHHRRERHRQQREMILDAAREIFVCDGYESLSMRKLADSIGYSAGTIYSYFSDKQDLVHTLVEESFATLLERLEMIPESDDPIATLRGKLHAYIDFGLENPSHYHFAFVLRRQPNETPTSPHEAFDVLRAAVRRCQREGHFGGVDAESASQILWVMIHGITSLLITHPGFPWVERRGLIARVVDGAIAGLEIDNPELGGHHEHDDPIS